MIIIISFFFNYHLYLLWTTYEDKVRSSRPSLRKTRDKRPLSRDPDMSWCHCHTTSLIKLFWSQPMDPWSERSTLVCCRWMHMDFAFWTSLRISKLKYYQSYHTYLFKKYSTPFFLQKLSGFQ